MFSFRDLLKKKLKKQLMNISNKLIQTRQRNKGKAYWWRALSVEKKSLKSKTEQVALAMKLKGSVEAIKVSENSNVTNNYDNDDGDRSNGS